jgi:hypothetical protein
MQRALYVAAGKHGLQSLVAASKCNYSDSRLCVTDQLTKMSFLVDTNADLFVYPRSRLRERWTRTSYVFPAHVTIVRTYGCISLHLDFGLRREFVVTDVTEPIIRSDVLYFYNFLVDIRHRSLIDVHNLTVNGASVGIYGGHIKVLAVTPRSMIFRI